MDRLLSEGRALGPWHLGVQVTPELNTSDLRTDPPPEGPRVTFYDPTVAFTALLARLFPGGLAGRSVLDCGCNCGAYLFLCRDHGAGECLGFDARELWIRQARWLLRHRVGDHEGMRFEVHDQDELPRLGLARFDVVLLRGILYHLPDPIESLRVVCDLTGEVLLVHTAAMSGWRDGALVASDENAAHPLSGTHGFHWFPTGPGVLMHMTRRFGLPASRCHRWWMTEHRSKLDRVDLVAARSPEALRAYDAGRARDLAGKMAELANLWVPPRSTVAVLAPVVPELPFREAFPFEPGEDPVAALDGCGADYLLTAGEGLGRANELGLLAHLNEAFEVVGQEAGVSVIHDLRRPRASAS